MSAPIENLLDQAIAGGHRSEKNKARDQYRHPKATLLFFGLRPEMSVAEIWPGGGWYTEILAPVLHERGKFYAARFSLKNAPDFRKETDADCAALLAANPGVCGKII